MSEAPFQRRTDLGYLIKLAESLRETLTSRGMDPATWLETCSESISARCITCGETMAGDEFVEWLLGFGLDRSGAGESMRFMRLRRGCCGMEKCNGHFYEFSFKPNESIDWAVLSVGALEVTEAAPRTSHAKIAARAATDSLARQFTRKSITAIVLLALLWLFRHWYTGGEIPVIQPAKTYTSEPGAQMDLMDPPPTR
jgi:hypothetical protein